MTPIIQTLLRNYILALLMFAAGKKWIPVDIASDSTAQELINCLFLLGAPLIAFAWSWWQHEEAALKAKAAALQADTQKIESSSAAKSGHVHLLFVILITWITFLVVVLTGCASSNNTAGNATVVTAALPADPAQNADYVRTVNATANGIGLAAQGAILIFHNSPQHELEYAKMVSGSAHVFEALEKGSIPSGNEVSNALSGYFPTTSSDYNTVVSASTLGANELANVIQGFLPAGLMTSSPAVYAAYVNYALDAVAKKLYSVSDPFLTAQGVTL